MAMTELQTPKPAQHLADLVPALAQGCKVVKIVTGDDGNARFETWDPAEDGGVPPTLWRHKATSVMINTVPAGARVPFHNSANTGAGTLLILLKGLAVYWVDDGADCGKSYYPHAPGMVIWGLDSTGRGHGGMVLEDAVVLQVMLAPGE